MLPFSPLDMLAVDQPLAKKARQDEDDTEDEDGTDREVVLAAVARNGYALRYAAARLQADHEVVLAAVVQIFVYVYTTRRHSPQSYR